MKTFLLFLEKRPHLIFFPVLDLGWHFFRGMYRFSPRGTKVEDLTLKLFKDYNLFLNKLEFAKRRSRLRSLPYHINLETTVRCNLKCPFCYREDQGTDLDKLRKTPDISAELLQSIAQQLFPSARTVNTSLSAEPFMVKNFDTLLDIIDDYNVRLHLITNGVLLKDIDFMKRLAPHLYRIDFSLDSLDPETFNRIRYPAQLETVLRNMEALANLRQTNSDYKFELGATVTIMRQNARDLPGIVKYIAKIGGTHVTGNFLILFDESKKEESLTFEPELYNSSLEEAEQLAEELGIRLEVPGPFSTGETVSEVIDSKKSCEMMYFQAFICSDGRLLTCCQYYPPQLGDLRESDFLSLWNSKRATFIRDTVNTPRAIIPCNDCYLIQKDPLTVEDRKKQHFIFLTSEQRIKDGRARPESDS